MSPERSAGVFDAIRCKGDYVRIWSCSDAGPMTERTNGLVPARSRGTKPILRWFRLPSSSGRGRREGEGSGGEKGAGEDVANK